MMAMMTMYMYSEYTERACFQSVRLSVWCYMWALYKGTVLQLYSRTQSPLHAAHHTDHTVLCPHTPRLAPTRAGRVAGSVLTVLYPHTALPPQCFAPTRLDMGQVVAGSVQSVH